MHHRLLQKSSGPATVPDVTPSVLDAMMRQSTLPLLVSFHSNWNTVMTPALSQIVAEAAGRLQAIQVDVCVYPQIAERFKVRIIPTLLIFKQGVPMEFVVGLVPRRFVRQTIRRAIGAISQHAAVRGIKRC